MFDILFGWRKASKCKNLIKRVQCRLKLLKNKRSCIIKQLRDDLSELLRNGHYEIVTERVEQLSSDERKVAVYDLLETYCEFIIFNLSYIRRHKDYPNDINEAVSTLIFASARLGDLPELVAIRKLFGERYGQRFETSALQLLPGNLVSHQIIDNICTSSVSEKEKYRLVDEIARSCFQQGPLLLEYINESHQEQVNEGSNAAADYKEAEQMRLKDPKISQTGLLKPENSACFSTTHTFNDSANCLKNNGNERVQDSAQQSYLSQSPISSPERVTGRDTGNKRAFISEKNIERRAAESSTEDLAELPEQMIYLDDIQEFESAVKKVPFVPLRLKIDTGSNFEGIKRKCELRNAKKQPKSSRKNNTIYGKRMRRKAVSVVSDTDSTIYYGDLRESSPDSKPKRQNRKRSSRKSYVKESHQPCYVKFRSTMTFVKCIDDHSRSNCNSRCNGPMENHCSLEHPCYYWIADGKDIGESPLCVPKRRVKATKDLSKCQFSCSQDVQSVRHHFVKSDTEEVGESQETCNSTMSSSSSTMTYQRERKENQAPYLRATTMPPERPKDSLIDNLVRSNSFPVQEPGNELYGSRHIHPKLPDYDELSAKFLALKNEKLQKKC
ncbi:uncharacterized protein LOC132620340 [Lycium barbarum]|uniref:uncharacterized protein LOC132620340 n=1 Tax=Lycium barbarum TaxID=112863 RepID=UPI00293F1444|nr:uncharacterized protein LOC132620340 [Lycium barbarum]